MTKYTIAFNTVLILIFCCFTLHAANNDSDAATPQPITFLPIDKKDFAKVTAYLSEQNQNLPQGTILSMGFEPDAENSWKKNLVIISLTSDNNPVKQSYEVDERFFTSLTQPAVTIGEQPSKVTGETTSLTADRTQDGRLYFMINTTARSLWVYPSGFFSLDIDGQTATGLALLTVGGALYGSYLFSKSLELGYGRVEFMNFGADMGGIWYPTLLRILLGNNLSDNYSDDDYNSMNQTVSSIAMLAYPLGIYAGSKMTFAGNYEYGNASVMTNMARSAPLYGYLVPLMFVGEDADGDYLNIATIASMALIPGGFAIGKAIVGERSISSGRSILMTSCGIFGALSGMMIPFIFTTDDIDVNVVALTTLLGHAGGTAFGHFYKAPAEYSYSQGVFTAVSGIVGTGIGIALPLLGSADTHEPYIFCGLAGCWGGVALGEHLSLSLFEKSTHDRRVAPSVTFPGLASLPMLFLSSRIGSESSQPVRRHTMPARNLTRATLVDVRF